MLTEIFLPIAFVGIFLVNPYGPVGSTLRRGATNPTPKKKSARRMTRPAPPWRRIKMAIKMSIPSSKLT